MLHTPRALPALAACGPSGVPSGVICHLRMPSPLTRPCRCPRPRSSRCHRAAGQRRCSPGRRHRAPRPAGIGSSCGERLRGRQTRPLPLRPQHSAASAAGESRLVTQARGDAPARVVCPVPRPVPALLHLRSPGAAPAATRAPRHVRPRPSAALRPKGPAECRPHFLLSRVAPEGHPEGERL